MEEIVSRQSHDLEIGGANPSPAIMGEYTVGVAGQSVKLMASVTDSSTLSSPIILWVGFESHQFHFMYYSPIAQLVERLAVNQNVAGSSPVGRVYVKILFCSYGSTERIWLF